MNKDFEIINSLIEEVNSNDLLKILNLRRKELELLIGGPPCQPFSKCPQGVLGTPLGFDDERANTISEYLRFVENLLPKVFVIENVPQFISGKNERVKEFIKRKIYRINASNRTKYKLSFCKINTAWYGVPQLRERLFIIGSRDGYDFHMPEIRFLDDVTEQKDMQVYRTSSGCHRPFQ